MNIPRFSNTIRPRIAGRIALLLALFTGINSFGQQFFFDQFSVSEGLAQSTIYSIIQDQNDILWLGTQAGVTRFDGTSFRNYTVDDGIAENGVRGICEDASGQIWFGHDGGRITRFDGNEFVVIPNVEQFLSSNITSIVEDSLHRIWITSEGNGALMIDNPNAPEDELIYRQYMGNELSDAVFSGYVDHSGKLYFVAAPNEKYFDPDSIKFKNLTLNGVPKYYMTTSLLVDSRGHTWIGKHNGGAYRYIPDRDTTIMYDFIKSGLSSNWISTIYEDRLGNVWIGTWGGGVARIDESEQVHTYTVENGLPGSKIWKIMQDREGNILIGTHEHGLCVFKGDHFISYFEEDGLRNPQVLAILETGNGDYWFGTHEGISILQKGVRGKKIIGFSKLEGERIRFLKEDKKGEIWIGTEAQGIFNWSQGRQLGYHPLINNNIDQGLVTALEIDRSNNLWVGTIEGLIYYEIDNNKMDVLTQTAGITGNNISALFEDSKERIWVGSMGKGITLISGSDISVVELGFNFSPTCFVEDHNNNIWIGTQGRGVMQYDPDEKKIIRTLSVNDGLLANLINSLNCDEYNNIYIGTNKGLNKYISSEDMIYSFTRRSGFTGIETKSNSTLLDSHGDIWFGTVAGVTKYSPELDHSSIVEPFTHITGLKVNYEPFPLDEKAKLSHNENSLIFDYRCITLNPDGVQYMIMMEGVDLDWRPPDNQTSVNYPALRHGRYTFLVKARNSEGIWNSEPVSYSLEIKPPFYLTYWFILSCIFAAGLLFFTYIKIRERALVRENKILEDKVRDRTAVVVAQKEELAQKNKDITDSIRYAKRIQFAILPPELPFEDTFILFKPKDIVSGDFYWLTEFKGKQFLSAVDCTGHGVPGAFMSIIGHNSLSKIVREYGIIQPGEILSKLNSEVVGTLHQRGDTGEEVYDGMDLALVCYDPKTKVLEYAGAFNPLYLVRNSELIETKADRISIGRSSFKIEEQFTTHTIDIEKGDTIYLFSDGYADQFGGEKMKKFKYKNLKEIILKIQDRDMEDQKTILNNTIEDWRGDIAQIDDILIIGRRF